jgi:hypothetical protein
MEETFAAYQALMRAARRKGPECLFEESLRETMQCDGVEVFAVVEHQAADRDAAQAARFFEDHVVDGRKVAGRAVDDLQDLGSCGLLLQGLAGLGDQPSVLNGNHRLVGKGADELDLPISKRLDPLAPQSNHADHDALAQQWHTEPGPVFSQCHGPGFDVFRVGGHVVDVDDLTLKRRLSSHGPAGRGQ